MTTPITEQIAAIINAEVARVTADKDAKIADLKTKLQDSEARWERLRSLLGAAPAPVPASPAPITANDAILADFHKRRRVGFVSIRELAEALNVNYSGAQSKYSHWCVRNGVARINYTSNGQQVTT